MLFLAVFFTLFLLLLMGLGTAKLLLFREKFFLSGIGSVFLQEPRLL